MIREKEKMAWKSHEIFTARYNSHPVDVSDCSHCQYSDSNISIFFFSRKHLPHCRSKIDKSTSLETKPYEGCKILFT